MGVLIKNKRNYSCGTQLIQPIIYSLEEREVGVWVDGKPLYEKTLYYAGPASGSIEISHGISDLDRGVYGIGSFHDHYGTDDGDVLFPRISNDGYNCGIIGINKTTIPIYIPTVFQSRPIDIYITVQYTKTTDTPGSGTWSSTGIQNHHYSETEQVVGTWIDGSTIYEKVITNLSINTDGTNWVSFSTVDASTWDNIIDAKIYRTLNSGKMGALPIAEYLINDGHPNISLVSSVFNSVINTATFTYTKSS